jgi:hypothetical protein
MPPSRNQGWGIMAHLKIALSVAMIAAFSACGSDRDGDRDRERRDRVERDEDSRRGGSIPDERRDNRQTGSVSEELIVSPGEYRPNLNIVDDREAFDVEEPPAPEELPPRMQTRPAEAAGRAPTSAYEAIRINRHSPNISGGDCVLRRVEFTFVMFLTEEDTARIPRSEQEDLFRRMGEITQQYKRRLAAGRSADECNAIFLRGYREIRRMLPPRT